MNIKRFFGKSSKEALNMVRKTLGENAVILSNRTMNGGNEIMAFKEEDMQALIENEQEFVQSSDYAAAKEHFRQQEAPSATQVSVTHASQKRHADFTLPEVNFNEKPRDEHAALDSTPGLHAEMRKFAKRVRLQEPANYTHTIPKGAEALIPPLAFATEEHAPAQITAMLKEMRQIRTEMESQLALLKNAPASSQDLSQQQKPLNQAMNMTSATPQSPQMHAMLKEVRDMRHVFESKLTTLSWANIQQQNPIKSSVLSTLLAAGFSASLSRQLLEKMPENLDGEKAKSWIKRILAHNLNSAENEETLLDQGGIYALIGPTGVGKTTTTAKLAARYVMKHGTQNLGIITTDAYRIGGHEQLRIYGKILGVMVHAVKDEADLKIALNELKNKHTILIDTVGVSQRDRMVAEQIAMLSNTQQPIKKLLCINATCTGETLTDVIRAYKGKGLDGCIMTKIDEAVTIGNALDVVIRGKLKLFYATNGQRVPEDIVMANKQYIIDLAFKQNTASNWPYQFLDQELPFVMGNSLHDHLSAITREIDYV